MGFSSNKHYVGRKHICSTNVSGIVETLVTIGGGYTIIAIIIIYNRSHGENILQKGLKNLYHFVTSTDTPAAESHANVIT